MSLRPATFVAALGIGALAMVSSAGVGAPAPPTQAETNAATFDAVWVTIRDTHWDPTLNGLNWDAVREELRPAATKALTADELRAVLHQLISRLGQSHFAILPGESVMEEASDEGPEAAPAADPAAKPKPAKDAPVRVRKRHPNSGITGATITLLPASNSPTTVEAVVTRIAAQSEASKAGIVPGTVVLSIDGESIVRGLPSGDGLERYEREAIADARATGRPGTTSTWRLRMPDGSERDATLNYVADPRPTTKFGNLPAMPISLEWSQLSAATVHQFKGGDVKIGQVAFDAWFVPIAKPFDQAIDGLRECDGIVLDLRGNPGGFGGMAMGIAGHFTPASETLGSMVMRGTTLNFVTNPRMVSADGKPVQTFAGSVAILVDVGTASTSEIFAGGLQYLGRARIFGSRTAGAALPAIFEELPNGDVFLHAIADYRLPDGRALEAAGVRPDLERTYTSLDYSRDGDPVLADAVRWIAAERAKGASGVSDPTKRTQEKIQ